MTTASGQIGYIVKGAAFAIVGGLFGWAGITYDPEKEEAWTTRCAP